MEATTERLEEGTSASASVCVWTSEGASVCVRVCMGDCASVCMRVSVSECLFVASRWAPVVLGSLEVVVCACVWLDAFATMPTPTYLFLMHFPGLPPPS